MRLNLKDLYSLNALAIFIAVLASLILAPNFFSYNVFPLSAAQHMSTKSLDVSWMVTQNFANFNNLRWGKEFVFTYGPLSTLGLRIPWGESKISFILFDVFNFINIFFLVFLSIKNNSNKIITFFALILLVLSIPNLFGADYAIIYFFSLLFWMTQSLEKPKSFYFIFQILCVIIMFFFKFNTGLIALVMFYFSLLYHLYIGHVSLIRFAVFSIVPLLLILLFSSIYNVALYDYIYYGLEMVKGYNDIMYLHSKWFSSYIDWVVLFSVCSVALLVSSLFNQKIQYIKIAFLTGVFILSLYILYKQSFVRGDIQHLREFFSFALLLVFCMPYFFKNKRSSKLNLLFIPIFLIPILVNKDEIKSKTKSISVNKENYFRQISEFNSNFGHSLQNTKNSLPDKVIEEIGDETVDIYPWDILLLFENKLNYLPRPVIQSYTAYTKALENLNFDLYNSEKGPEYVIYHYGSIDKRYPLFDEPKLNLVLELNYKPLFKFNFSEENLILFKKKPNFKPIKLIFQDEYAIKLGAPFVPEENMYYEVEHYHTMKGNLYSIARNSPEMRLRVLDDNFVLNDYKTSNALLQSGIYSKTYFKTTNDVYYNFRNDTTYQNSSVRAYYFKPKNREHFKDKVRIKTYKIEQ